MILDFNNDAVHILLESQAFDVWSNNNALEAIILDSYITDGIVEIMEDYLSIQNEDLYLFDLAELEILGFPKPYPYSAYLDSSSISTNGIDAIYKKSAPIGEILPFKRYGVSLQNQETIYLLDKTSFQCLKILDNVGGSEFQNFTQLSRIKKILSESNSNEIEHSIYLSDLLRNTVVEISDKIKVEPEIHNEKLNLIPSIEGDNENFQKKFKLYPTAQKKYTVRNEGMSKRVLFDEKQVELLNKLKEVKKTATSEEFDEILNNPELLFSEIDENYDDVFDINYFSSRVIELGLYKPKFYPFIAPYKSQWIPGIQIKDKRDGTINIPVKSQSELNELEEIITKAKNNNTKNIIWRNRDLDTKSVENILPIIRKQIQNPSKPVEEAAVENSDKKVLIIKENTLNLDYKINAINDFELNLIEEITNLKPNIKLKDHQEEGVRWLQTVFEKENEGCLLADDMGLGKTFQVLYFLEWYYQKTGSDKPSIIISPISLLENWEEEYHKFFSKKNFKLEVHNSKSPIPKNFDRHYANLISGKKVLLTNYETIKSRQLTLASVDFGVIIADEVQKIKTPGTLITNAVKALKSDFKIPMTGTPIENSFTDIWCILDFSIPGFLGAAKEFSDEFQKPLRNPDTDRVELGNKLRSRIGNLMLRRMKTDVVKDLPEKVAHYIPMEMTQTQLDAYATVSDSYQEGKKGDALRVIQQLKQVSEHPYLLSKKLINVDINDLINTSAKFKWLINTLKNIEYKKEKVIIFAEYREVQHALVRVIQYSFGVSASVINGDTPTSASQISNAKLSRQQAINRFGNIKDFNVIVMSPKAAGVGLNVVAANHVIHLSRHWNPAVENQATDRAYRIGQTKNVNVYYPICELPDPDIKSFDQVLNDLLNQKSSLADSALYPLEMKEVNQIELGRSILGNKMNIESKRLDAEDLYSIDPYHFESLVAVIYDKQGYDAQVTPKQNDMGVDVVVMGVVGQNNYLIQCKTSSKAIDKSAVSEVMIAKKYYEKKYDLNFELIVATNSVPNGTTESLAQQNAVKILSKDDIISLLKAYNISHRDVFLKEQQRL
jgi:SNF2 family DNA or RNA helicase/HJR/Mrr/RecB family endonuclease